MVSVTLVTSSCSLIRRNQGKTPPPVIAAPPTKPPETVENPQVPPPPKVEQSASPTLTPPETTQIPAKPPTPKPVKRPARRNPVPVRAQLPPPPPTVEAQPQTPVATAPDSTFVLAPILSTAQQEAFNKAIDAAVQQTESDLAALANKQLNPAQRANADRAKSFISQAQQTRTTDLVTAKTLADRASVLAQSLVSELR